MELFLSFYAGVGAFLFGLFMAFPSFQIKERNVEVYNSKKNGVLWKDLCFALICGVFWLPLLVQGIIFMNKGESE